MRGARHIVTGLLMAVCGPGFAFEQGFEAPAFVLSMPGIPDVPLVSAPAPNAAGASVASGHAGAYSVEVSTVASALAASTRSCAGAFLRDLVKRPHMPDRDSIYRAPLDASTFLVLYILAPQGRRVLHAHLLSAAAGTHCVEAHVYRDMGDNEDEDQWRTRFTDARIREGLK